MPSPAAVRRLTDLGDPALVTAARIYVDALPASERKPPAWLRSLPHRPGYALTVAEQDGTAVGLAVLFAPADPADAALLEYLAVAAEARGGGVGGHLLAEAMATAGRPLLVEVQAGDADAERREAFYRRHGCRAVVGLQYLCPLPDAPPMRLMVGGTPTLRRADLCRWLATVYADVYGQRRNDPRLATMAAALPDPINLR